MRHVLLALALALATPTPGVDARQPDSVRIVITGYVLRANGPDESNYVSQVTDTKKMGAPSGALFAVHDCGFFSVQGPLGADPGPDTFFDGATSGWRLQVTPTRVVDHVVTFRLRWDRVVDKSEGAGPRSEDIELTLRPGESRPIDSVPVASKAGTVNGRPCNVKSASLRVSAEFPNLDGRLVGAEIWLVERLPGGKEQSQLQTVRGRPHQEIPFHFDRVSDGKNSFDFSGHITADIETGGIKIDLETIRAVPDTPATRDGYQAARWFRSTVRVTPNEIVEVALTETPPSPRAPAGRVFALRIRARQLR
jgi:hypothetical protein